MKIKKLFTILTVLCFSALAGVVFLKFVDNKKNARDIALANVESLANAEGDGIGNEDNPSTTIKKCVSSSEFTKDDSTGESIIWCVIQELPKALFTVVHLVLPKVTKIGYIVFFIVRDS